MITTPTNEEVLAKNAELSKALSEAIKELEKKEASFFLLGYLRDTLSNSKIIGHDNANR